jgi:adenine-specific DNA-methyltransferase
MLRIATSENDIILDFFAGSGTTAHAVMAQNAADGGNRQWILVQLPEKTEEDSDAFKAGYKTIADIAKERIRRAVEKLEDKTGFKVFKLAESNYPENTFEFDPDKTEEENKSAFEDYLQKAKQNKLIDDVDTTSVIYENIVKEGFSLNAKIQEGVVGNNKVYTITDGERQFSICLDREIDGTTVKNITEWAKGITFICFDNALNDSAKANLGLHVELKTI